MSGPVGPHVEKWTYLLVWVQVDGVVDNLPSPENGSDTFDLIADEPFATLSNLVRRNNLIKCETYPIDHSNDPNSVNPNLSGDEASARLGLPMWPLPMKSPAVNFSVQTRDGSRPLENGDHVRLTGHLMVENGHPDAGGPWLELHPFDYTNIVLLTEPPLLPPDKCGELSGQQAALRAQDAQLARELARTNPPPTAGERAAIIRAMERVGEEIEQVRIELDKCQGSPDARTLLDPTGTAAVVAPLYSVATYSGLAGGNVGLAALTLTVSSSVNLSYPVAPGQVARYTETVIENSTGLPLNQLRTVSFDATAGTLRVNLHIQSRGAATDDLLSQRSAFHATYKLSAAVAPVGDF